VAITEKVYNIRFKSGTDILRSVRLQLTVIKFMYENVMFFSLAVKIFFTGFCSSRTNCVSAS